MNYKLIAFDIDGTITGHVSSWRYIHEKMEIWTELAEKYQEDFLKGRISYRRFCELDAAHWKGLPERDLERIFRKVPYAKGVSSSIRRLKKAGFKLVAISTGLQYIARRIEKELGFDHVVSNVLLSRRGVLTGGVRINIGYRGKGRSLRKILKRFRVGPEKVISIGDSSGDIPMIKYSGYSIAFNSSDNAYSNKVDYNCRGKDFRKVYERILRISSN